MCNRRATSQNTIRWRYGRSAKNPRRISIFPQRPLVPNTQIGPACGGRWPVQFVRNSDEWLADSCQLRFLLRNFIVLSDSRKILKTLFAYYQYRTIELSNLNRSCIWRKNRDRCAVDSSLTRVSCVQSNYFPTISVSVDHEWPMRRHWTQKSP